MTDAALADLDSLDKETLKALLIRERSWSCSWKSWRPAKPPKKRRKIGTPRHSLPAVHVDAPGASRCRKIYRAKS